MQAYHDPLRGGLKRMFDTVVASPESVQMVLQGSPGEALVISNQKIMILRVGYTAVGKLFGKQVEAYSLERIRDAQVRTGFGGGRLHLMVLPTYGKVRDIETVVHFPKMARDKFRMAANVIRQLAQRNVETAVAGAHILTGKPKVSYAEETVGQIRRLAELREDGILTEKEFLQKKQELLMRL